MTDAVQIALIVAIPPTIVALTGLVVSLKNNKKLATTDAKVDVLHIDLNSRLSQLIAASAVSERAQGHAAGLAEGRSQSITERQDRTVESERVTDREREISKE